MGDLDPIIHPAANVYQPLPYAGRVVFFHSSDWPQGSYWKLHRGWTDLVQGEFEVHFVPGEHESMLQKSVDTIAAQLSSLCQNIVEPSDGSLADQGPVEQEKSAKTATADLRAG